VPSRLAVLRSVAAALGGATDQSEVADAVLRAVGEHLGAVTASVWLLTPDGRELHVAAQRNAHPEAMARFARVPVDADLPGPDVVRTGRPWFVRSRAERDEAWPAVAGTPSPSEALVVLPLATGADPIGVLSFGFPEPREFDDDDRTALLAIADQCAIAIDRARLYEGLRADADANHLLARISAVGDLDDWTRLADRAVQACVDGFVDLCVLYLQEGTVLQRVALASRTYGDLAADLIGRFPTSLSADAPSAVAVRTGRPVELPAPRDRPLREPWASPAYAERIEGVRPGGGWVLPLRHGDRTFGAMLFAAAPGEHLDDRAFTLAQQVAERTAALLQSAAVFADRRATLESLHGVLVPMAMPAIDGLDIGVCYVPYSEAGFAGGILHLYTDGLVESRHRHLDDGLAELAREAAAPPDERMQQHCERLLANLVQRPEDDICLLVTRRTDPSCGVS